MKQVKLVIPDRMNLPVKALLLCILCAFIIQAEGRQKRSFKAKTVYRSSTLVVKQVTENTFVQISYKQTDDFGKVPCNGLIVRSGNETIIFDTPTHDSEADELIRWIEKKLHCRITAVIPTHFHDDCLGGLSAFHKKDIPSYACERTIRLAKENNYTVPQNSFTDSLFLPLGNNVIEARYFGEGHTRDNIVGYFAADSVLFGGCLTKTINAGKGYIADANTAAWPATVEKVKQFYPHARWVIPGHGEYGNRTLLDYTIALFREP